MGRTRVLLSLLLVAGAGGAVFGATQEINALEDRWTGSWVVTSTETFSDCAGFYTDNEVYGDATVRSRGRQHIDAGTPARVDSVDIADGRLSLRLTLSVNQMVERPHRDFTLRALARCQAEVRVMVPPDTDRNNVAGLEALLDRVVERHSDQRSALLASNFLPLDTPEYEAERTEAVAEHREWRQGQSATALQARLDQWTAQTARLSNHISQDPDYLSGFGRGVDAGRSTVPTACEEVTHFEPAPMPGRGGDGAAFAAKGNRQKNWSRGYEDGVRLAQGLEMIRLLPGCMPPAPAPRPAKTGPSVEKASR